jgi:hypothetical protein
MPTIAELLDRGTAERLALARVQAEQGQAEAKAAPVQAATCQACGQRLPAPAAVFRSGAEHQAQAAYVDPSRAGA